MKRKIVVLLVVLCLAVSIAAPAFATSYSLNIPYPFSGSMQSTALYVKQAGESPYVDQHDANGNPLVTIPTNYFLSPQRVSSVDATSIVTLTSGYRSLTYKSGYGGVGTSYCLSAYPGVSGSYDPYNVRGTWSR